MMCIKKKFNSLKIDTIIIIILYAIFLSTF